MSFYPIYSKVEPRFCPPIEETLNALSFEGQSFRDRLIAGWVPQIGIQGRKLVNFIEPYRYTAVCNETARPTWGISQAGISMEWDADDIDSYLEIGDISNFRFEYQQRWSLAILACLTNVSTDERSLVAKWISGNNRQFILRTASGTAPVGVQFYNSAALRLTSGSVINTDIWYLVCLSNDAGSVTLRIYEAYTAKLLDSSSTTITSDENDLTAPIQIYGRQGGDEMRGFAGPVYFINGVLDIEEERELAFDPFLPVRPREEWWFVEPADVGNVISPSGLGVNTSIGGHQLNVEISVTGLTADSEIGTHAVSEGETLLPSGLAAPSEIGDNSLGVNVKPSGLDVNTGIGNSQLNNLLGVSGLSVNSEIGGHQLDLEVDVLGLPTTSNIGGHEVIGDAIILPPSCVHGTRIGNSFVGEGEPPSGGSVLLYERRRKK